MTTIQWLGTPRSPSRVHQEPFGPYAGLGQAQAGGAECRDAFVRWQELAPQAVSACEDAATWNIEWWRQEDQRIAGDPFFDQDRQDSALRTYETAQNNCNAVNGASLTAMASYEGCMTSLGLDPTKPSAATGDAPPTAPKPKPAPRPPPPPSTVPVPPLTTTSTPTKTGGTGGLVLLAAAALAAVYAATQLG